MTPLEIEIAETSQKQRHWTETYLDAEDKIIHWENFVANAPFLLRPVFSLTRLFYPFDSKREANYAKAKAVGYQHVLFYLITQKSRQSSVDSPNSSSG